MSSQQRGAVPLDAFRAEATEAIARARSIDEIVGWLQAQALVISVRVGDALLKSQPPQREVVVQRTGHSAAARTVILYIYELGPDRFELKSMSEI